MSGRETHNLVVFNSLLERLAAKILFWSSIWEREGEREGETGKEGR